MGRRAAGNSRPPCQAGGRRLRARVPVRKGGVAVAARREWRPLRFTAALGGVRGMPVSLSRYPPDAVGLPVFRLFDKKMPLWQGLCAVVCVPGELRTGFLSAVIAAWLL